MKKVMLLLTIVSAFGLAACSDNFTNSPEQKAFQAFLAKCKANPSTPDCVEFAKPQGQ
jgi:hypothetical protein